MQLERVIIGVDFSEASCACARWTVQFFARGARATLVHVVSGVAGDAVAVGSGAAYHAAVEKCSRLRATLPGEDLETEIASGSIPDELARVALIKGADLIAIGKHGAGRGAARGVGSVSQQLILHPTMPVLLGTGIREGPPRSILAAVGNDQARVSVVRWARWLSERFDAACVALSVVGSEVHTHLLSMAGLAARGGGVSGLEFQERATEATGGWIAELSSMDSHAQSGPDKIERSHTAEEVTAAAERLHSDLIVLGSGLPRGTMPEWSVACTVAGRSSCPVLVVKPDAAA